MTVTDQVRDLGLRPPVMSAEAAEAAGYVAITNPFHVVDEARMIPKFDRELRGTTSAWVHAGRLQIELWRHRSECRFSAGENKAVTSALKEFGNIGIRAGKGGSQ